MFFILLGNDDYKTDKDSSLNAEESEIWELFGLLLFLYTAFSFFN